MKRFVVLCSVVALISLSVYVSWATAPAISDLPDTRLEAGPGGGGTGLSNTLNNAYNVEEFIKDFDDDVSALTITLPPADITMIDPPPSQAPNLDGGLPTIQLDGSNNVDVFGRATPGWARYTVNVDDASNPVSSRTAVAKYSSFALNTPSLSEGRFFNLTAGGWQFAYAWMGQNVAVSDLNSTVTPPTSVDWEVYMNDVTYEFDANGNLLGINPQYIAHGSAVSAQGWNVSISSTGGIVLSTDASFSPGPFLIGVLAINQSDADDIDATRIMIAGGLLGLATPGSHSQATHDKSETLDGLTPGPVTVTPNGGDSRIPIQEGSHWAALFLGDDIAFDVAQVDIVDLALDGPPAGAPGPNIASGNALKVSFDPTTWTNPEAVRLLSRAITDLQAGEVYTFAANIATDITNATHSPNFLMALTSPLGAKAQGFNLEHVSFGPGDPEYVATQGTILDAYQKDIAPDATEGWQTLSVNYSPPLTPGWLDLNGDSNFDQADLDIIADLFGNPLNPALYEGWSDERTVAKAALRIAGRDDMTTPFSVWLDNLRIYRSAYELDLGLEKTEYTIPVTITGNILPSFITQPSGNITGSFEGSTVLDTLGFRLDDGGGLLPPHLRSPLGPFAVDASIANADSSSFQVISGPDHTKSGSSSQTLQIQLAGAFAPPAVTARAWIDTAIVLLPGSGIYALEAYITMAGGQNQTQTNRAPKYTVALNQMAPNPLATAYGSVFSFGGTANSIADDGWDRVVGTGYIPDTQAIPGKQAVMARGLIQAIGDFNDSFTNFTTAKAYVDDMRVLRVDDPAKFFDADLFDSI